jgi:hypothetical protein
MMAGPQEMAAIVLVTHPRPVRVSPAFVAGVVVAATIGVTVALLLAGALDGAADLGDPGSIGSLGVIIQLVLVALLLGAALKTYLTRATAEPPRWLGRLLTMDAWRAFRTGCLVIVAMPSDLVVMFAVGVNLQQHDEGVAAALPFLGLTALIAALPLLAYLLFRPAAERVMPRVRDWMNANSWVINIAVSLFFVVLILA